MHLRYALLMAVATLAASSSVVMAAHASDEANLAKMVPAAQVDTAHAIHEINRFLRSSDTKTADDDSSDKVADEKVNHPKFIEHKLQNALTNPKKTNRLYQYWDKKGYTAKDVAGDLGQTENRELSHTYKTLSSGYAVYLKKQSSE